MRSFPSTRRLPLPRGRFARNQIVSKGNGDQFRRRAHPKLGPQSVCMEFDGFRRDVEGHCELS